MDQGQTSRSRKARAIATQRTDADAWKQFIARAAIAAGALAAALQVTWIVSVAVKLFSAH